MPRTFLTNDQLNLDFPLKISATHPTADAVLNISSNQVDIAGTGLKATSAPIQKQIPLIPASTINFQTGGTTGATFSLAFPASTVGQFRRLGLTVLASGTINGIFSAEAASVGALANPGTLFVSNGTPIGYIDLECTQASPARFKTAGSATNIIENAVSGNARIFVFGSGAGGGGGVGDANSFLEDLKARLRDSFWGRMAPNIFQQNEQTYINGSSTGAYDVANSEYDLSTSGQFFLSNNLAGSVFLSSSNPLESAELQVLWGTYDPNATYELSVNGATFQALTMNRVDSSPKVVGELSAFNPSNSTIHEYAVGNADGSEAFNATTRQFLAMPIVVGSGVKQKAVTGNIYLNKLGATTGGDLNVKLVKDISGSPSLDSADLVAESAPINISSLATGDITVPFTLNGIMPAGTYWLLLTPSSDYRTNPSTGFSAGVRELRWRKDSSSPTYTAGDLRAYNGSAWSAITGEDACFQILGFGYDLRIRITAGSPSVSIAGMGVFFEQKVAVKSDTPLPEFERFSVNGSSDVTTLTVTRFIPDPETIRVINPFSKEILTYPDHFSINGRDLIFPSGTFLFPGETRLVSVDQRMGFGQGNDRAMAILAANALGSLDAAFDLSIAGKGILLKRPDGTLRMVRLDNSDNVVIESVP